MMLSDVQYKVQQFHCISLFGLSPSQGRCMSFTVTGHVCRMDYALIDTERSIMYNVIGVSKPCQHRAAALMFSMYSVYLSQPLHSALKSHS
jgi:hypothetical protein